jgi:hypothetical protein
MTDNVTIRIGANASQAIREIGKVRSAAGGLGKGLMAWRSGMGIAGGMFGVNAIVEAMRPIKEGFLEATSQSEAFSQTLLLINEGLKEFGRVLASAVIPVFERFSELIAWFIEKTQGRFAAELFKAGLKGTAAGLPGFGKPELIGPPIPPGFEEERKQREKQTEYQRRMTESLEEMNRDMKKTQLLDPW